MTAPVPGASGPAKWSGLLFFFLFFTDVFTQLSSAYTDPLIWYGDFKLTSFIVPVEVLLFLYLVENMGQLLSSICFYHLLSSVEVISESHSVETFSCHL